MPGIQEIIYKLEEGGGTKLVKLVFLVLALLGLAAVYDMREYKSFNSPEAMDAAQLARNIANGEGYTTDYVRPLSAYLIQQHELQTGAAQPQNVYARPHPDLANPPVYPFFLAGLMKVLPFKYEMPGAFTGRYQPEFLIAFANQALFFASIFVVYRLARRLLDPTAAALTAVIFAATDLYWKFSVSGQSTHLLIFLFLLLAWCLAAMEQNMREETKSGGWLLLMAACAGLILGVGALTRYSFGWLVLPTLAFFALFFGARRASLGLSALAVFALVLAPWLVRNYSISGSLFGTAGYAIFQDTSPFAGNRLERFVTSQFDNALVAVTLDDFIRKLMVNTASIVQEDLPRLGGSWVTVFFLAGLLVPFRSPALSRLRVFALLSLATMVVAQALGKGYLSSMSPQLSSENLLAVIAPLIFVFGVGMYLLLLDTIEFPIAQLRAAAHAVFLLAVSAPLIFTLLPPRGFAASYPPYWPPLIKEASGFMTGDELMMSDMPWAVAWYGDRKCLWLTLDAPNERTIKNRESDFFAIHDFQKPIQGLYLTRLTTDGQFFSQILLNPDWAWGKFLLDSLLKTNVPTGFPLKYSPPYYLREGQLFLTDFPRWGRPSQ